MTQFDITEKNRVARLPQRGKYDSETIYKIVDEALICHVGLVEDGQPVVIPTLHARKDDRILLHGSSKSRLLQYAQAGGPLCVTITLVDGLVLARSVFHHSINYRSVVLFGRGEVVPEAEKMSYLEHFTRGLLPGRWEDARPPDEIEMKATAIVAMPIELASAKIRTGPPVDEETDLDLPVWAGVLPVRSHYLPPEPDPLLRPDIPFPAYLAEGITKRP
jgi:nitroimidazol reductase NimA-like FMN-containing flavoprotein (pyridoxamine 5'-phosphate oxidase superfamily)